jgi:hypothetical protein
MVSQMKIGAHDRFKSLEIKIPSILPDEIVITGSSKIAEMICISEQGGVNPRRG